MPHRAKRATSADLGPEKKMAESREMAIKLEYALDDVVKELDQSFHEFALSEQFQLWRHKVSADDLKFMRHKFRERKWLQSQGTKQWREKRILSASKREWNCSKCGHRNRVIEIG